MKAPARRMLSSFLHSRRKSSTATASQGTFPNAGPRDEDGRWLHGPSPVVLAAAAVGTTAADDRVWLPQPGGLEPCCPRAILAPLG
jgi:hypothetical protein